MPIEIGSLSIGAVAGGAIGAIISHYLTKSRLAENRKITEFNKAADLFRTAFIEVQGLLDQSKSFDITAQNGTRVITILKNHIVAHEKAMFAFRPYIHRRKLDSFDKAWKEYYSQKNEFAECLSDYKPVHIAPSIEDPKHENDNRKLAVERINNLLKFAKPK